MSDLPDDDAAPDEEPLDPKRRKRPLSKAEEFLGKEVDASLAAAMERRTSLAAVALKVHGADYDEIADTLDLASPAIARVLVERALAATVDETRDLKGQRAIANLQIDAILRSTFPRATDSTDPEHLNYARMTLSLVDRKAKLNGLDAPVVHLINPEAEELERWVAQFAAAAGLEPQEEGDIFQLTEGPTGAWSPADEEPRGEGDEGDELA